MFIISFKFKYVNKNNEKIILLSHYLNILLLFYKFIILINVKPIVSSPTLSISIKELTFIL